MKEPRTIREAAELLRAKYPGEYVVVEVKAHFFPHLGEKSDIEVDFRVYREGGMSMGSPGMQATGPSLALALEGLAALPVDPVDVTTEGEVIAHDAPGVPQAVRPDECEECSTPHGGEHLLTCSHWRCPDAKCGHGLGTHSFACHIGGA